MLQYANASTSAREESDGARSTLIQASPFCQNIRILLRSFAAGQSLPPSRSILKMTLCRALSGTALAAFCLSSRSGWRRHRLAKLWPPRRSFGSVWRSSGTSGRLGFGRGAWIAHATARCGTPPHGKNPSCRWLRPSRPPYNHFACCTHSQPPYDQLRYTTKHTTTTYFFMAQNLFRYIF